MGDVIVGLKLTVVGCSRRHECSLSSVAIATRVRFKRQLFQNELKPDRKRSRFRVLLFGSSSV